MTEEQQQELDDLDADILAKASEILTQRVIYEVRATEAKAYAEAGEKLKLDFANQMAVFDGDRGKAILAYEAGRKTMADAEAEAATARDTALASAEAKELEINALYLQQAEIRQEAA